MENMQYAEELVREFLIFRGFTNTLQAFETELCTDIGKGFQVNKILDLIFAVYIPKFQAEKLAGLFSFFKQCFSSWSETTMLDTLLKLEGSVLRCYIVHALQSGRKDKVVEFFGMNGNDLLLKSYDWTPWFAIPYLKNPNMDPQFRVYFSKEWYEALRLSVRNFFSEVFNENGREVLGEEEFPEVSIEFQETFLGHTSPITRCRFSASGNNIASASVDGTVRIWTYDSSIPASRNATIYCGAEIMSLDWECKSDRLLLIGTADGGIKAWNVDAKRVVCDLNTTEAFPSVLDLKCSPVEPIFVSAASSQRLGSNSMESLGYASLTVWNMKTWKAMTVLPLGEDPPAITSLCFNHNGKILAASATDGMIHMFDMSAGLQITGWPAHDSAISSLLFGPDETSIFSLGSDGRIFEWSLQNQGRVLWSKTSSRFSDLETSNYYRHEMALDANGRQLLVTSGSVRAPIYQVQGHSKGLRTLPHSAAITTVDWHPTLPIFLTGSADNSVRVTSIS
ncbi:WD repeat-containing protein 91 homolog isoform X5 [Durio zibethinus]|uniref:WD repeat-containing protein 91 homolog isoform X5 n=1 Tax=Durio zibethinus TaxID=66656 RepID=A0A6P5YEY9_DURZI|nr:WD repeat-containing protein 91 homolog isoform X5 [Durio zibethinus]